MSTRPSSRWRLDVAQEASDIALGLLSPDEAFMARLFPVEMLDRTDVVLAAFEDEVSRLQRPTDEQVFAAVERVVVALNTVNEAFDGSAYETGEREQLCDYIDSVLTDAGVDIPALTARHGLRRYALTDRWRDW